MTSVILSSTFGQNQLCWFCYRLSFPTQSCPCFTRSLWKVQKEAKQQPWWGFCQSLLRMAASTSLPLPVLFADLDSAWYSCHKVIAQVSSAQREAKQLIWRHHTVRAGRDLLPLSPVFLPASGLFTFLLHLAKANQKDNYLTLGSLTWGTQAASESSGAGYPD